MSESKENIQPETLLSKPAVSIIKEFASESKGKYVAFDPNKPSEHYHDCTTYSEELKGKLDRSREISEDAPISFLTVCRSGKTVLFGTEVDFPSSGIHCALTITKLGIVIEPQTGDILFKDNAKEYYEKALKINDIQFLVTPNIIDKSNHTK